MPYILSADREKYTESLDKLLYELTKQYEDDLGGHLNFCVSYLMKRLWEDKNRYVRVNTLIGAIEGAKQEFYRCQVAKYEDKKADENGEV